MSYHFRVNHGIGTLGNDATQRDPFLQTIASDLRLPLLMQPIKLTLYRFSYFIPSDFHVSVWTSRT